METEQKETRDLVAVEAIADDFLIEVAEHAERRIDAVKKIKNVALKVTNARDWTDQQGNPYLQASGSEKIANLFNISWRIDEPICEDESDGHYTYSYKGYFSLGGRTIEAEGSRSSRDPFFKQYKYKDEKGNKLEPPQEILVSERSNKRDVKMAALTNLLGNGITRILGIRNLTWEDLKEFAEITKDQVTSIQYRKGGEPIQKPQSKNGETPKGDTQTVITKILNVTEKDGLKSDKKTPYTLYTIIGEMDGKQTGFKTFSKTDADKARAEKGSGLEFEIVFRPGKYGDDLVEISPAVKDENAQS